GYTLNDFRTFIKPAYSMLYHRLRTDFGRNMIDGNAQPTWAQSIVSSSPASGPDNFIAERRQGFAPGIVSPVQLKSLCDCLFGFTP
ncbi:MAG: hypothetical protein WBN48_22135, partial [Thiogranum sp.]